MFAASRLKICPRVLMSEWAGYVMKARSWHETGQLGVSFITAPEWVNHAFALLDNATTEALDFKRENSK